MIKKLLNVWGGRLRVSKGCVLGEYCVGESEGKKRGEGERSESDRGSKGWTTKRPKCLKRGVF